MHRTILLVLTVVPALYGGGIRLQVDHATVCGSDLRRMQTQLAAAGINSDYGGKHANRATEMAVTSFADGSYLELIAVQPAGDANAIAAHEWSKQMRGNAGPCAWAARSSDVASEAKRLTAAGIAVANPEKSGRNRPDGVRLDWQTAQVGPEPRGSLFPFLIQDFTSRDARVFMKGAASSKDFAGISRVVIAVKDLGSAVAQYRKAYGLAAPQQIKDSTLGAQLAVFDGTPVVLANPISSHSWMGERLSNLGEGPVAFILKLKGGNYTASSKSTWAPTTISWFEENRLGWRMGFE
jgi:hypothetical protein